MKQIISYLILQIVPFLTLGQNVEGTVTDFDTHLAVPGVSIHLLNTTLGSSTNNDGYFRINNLRPGSHKIKISDISHFEIDTTVNIVSGQTTVMNFVITSLFLKKSYNNISYSKTPENILCAVRNFYFLENIQNEVLNNCTDPTNINLLDCFPRKVNINERGTVFGKTFCETSNYDSNDMTLHNFFREDLVIIDPPYSTALEKTEEDFLNWCNKQLVNPTGPILEQDVDSLVMLYLNLFHSNKIFINKENIEIFHNFYKGDEVVDVFHPVKLLKGKSFICQFRQEKPMYYEYITNAYEDRERYGIGRYFYQIIFILKSNKIEVRVQEEKQRI